MPPELVYLPPNVPLNLYDFACWARGTIAPLLIVISRRTVQTHISHALAKLGVASRRELAAEAVRHAGWRIRVASPGEQMEQPEPAREGDARTIVDGQDA